MPWKERSVVEERMRFVLRLKDGRIQGFTYLLLLRGLIPVRFGFHDHLPCGMKPGTPVFTTSFSRCLV